MGILLDVAYLGAGLAASPWLAFKAARDPRYRHGLAERFGRVPVPASKRPLWIHAASVGEVNAVRPLVGRLRSAVPGMGIYVSTMTRAGRQQAGRSFPYAEVAYFPLDLTAAVRLALSRVRPRGVVLVELEVWPNFVEECWRRGVPVAVINGRMSRRSFARYRRLGGFFRGTFRRLRVVGAINEVCAARLRELGARVVVTGNLKFDADVSFDPGAAGLEWRGLLGLGDAPVIVAGSTHDPEELMIVRAYGRLKAEFPRLRLVVAPRHLERADEVVKVIEAAGFSCYKRSLLTPGRAEDGVIILDTVGELARLYAAATVVFIGGTFGPRGGQNMLEPAALGKPIVSGPSLSNFEDVAGALVEAGGMAVAAGQEELEARLAKVLRDPEAGREAGRRAREAVAEGKGAMEATLELIRTSVLGG